MDLNTLGIARRELLWSVCSAPPPGIDMAHWVFFDFEGSPMMWVVVGSTIMNMLDIEEEEALNSGQPYDPNPFSLLGQIL